MIKINLLPQKRAKLRSVAAGGRAGGASDAGAKQFAIGIGGLLAAAALVFVLVDMPRRDRIRTLEAAKVDLNKQVAEKRTKLAGYEDMKKAKADAEQRAQAINRLMSAKVVPAHVLHELSEILTQNRLPAMTEEMRKAVGNGPESNPNKRFELDWDPTTVWFSGYTDKAGVFRLDGGARDEKDVSQLSKRLQASVYFYDVTPAGGERVVDRERGFNYYRFTITGRVAY